VVVLYRRGRRAEALTIGGVALATFAYNAGYYLPFGGDVPGPRFLVAALPFLAVGLAVALRERPAPTLGLAAASALLMVTATATEPQLVGQDVGRWAQLVGDADFQFTALGAVAGSNGWLNVLPFVLLAGAAAVLAVHDARLARVGRRETLLGLGVVGGWALVALLVPPLLGDRSAEGALLVAVAAVAGLAAVVFSTRASRAPRPDRFTPRRVIVRVLIVLAAAGALALLVPRLADQRACSSARTAIFAAAAAGGVSDSAVDREVRTIRDRCGGTEALLATAGALVTLERRDEARAFAREATRREPESFLAWRSLAAMAEGAGGRPGGRPRAAAEPPVQAGAARAVTAGGRGSLRRRSGRSTR
jgi:hypothetical protein